jgi:hypothetical protein
LLSSSFTVFLVSVLLSYACASSPAKVDLSRISIGMTKGQVAANLGQPVNVVGAKQYADGSVEVLQYGWDTNQMWDGRPGAPGRAYYLYFFNDRLMQWGPAENWESKADDIYENRSQ